MDAITSLREGFGFTHMVVEGTMEGVTDEQAHWQPSGLAHSISSTYAHLVLGEDNVVHGMIQGTAPLSATTWDGKTGISEMPPARSEAEGNWDKWATSVRIDIAALREYAKAVYAATDAYLSSLTPEDLDRQIQAFGPDKQSINWMLMLVASHASNHIGEISAIKGIQGLRGYPF